MAKTYAEAIFEKLKNKFVEVHTGDTRKVHQYADYTLERKSVIRGTLIDVDGDLLVVKALTKTNKETIVYINGWGVTLVTDYEETTNITDIYQDEDIPLHKKMKQ